MSRAINVCAPSYQTCDSYGILASQLVMHLSGFGLHVNAHALISPTYGVQDEALCTLLEQPHQPAVGGIVLGYPDNLAKFSEITQDGPRVIISMWESSAIPAGWAEKLNQCQAVIVPSTFCATTFRECGVRVPVHTIPLGINETYKPYRRPQPGAHGAPLTFLAFLDRGARKGGLVAQDAFLLAFGDDPAYHLILKMRKPKVEINLLNENITVIQADYTEQEMYELYCRADVLIDPNKGEGFGLLGREFSATGGVTLSTDWGGTADDLSAWGYPIPYKLVPADWAGHAKFAGQDLGMWAEIDPEELSLVLRHVAEHRNVFCQSAEDNAPNVRALYSWRAFAGGVLDVWRQF